MQQDIAKWANKVFPDRTAHKTLSKLMLEEIPEVVVALRKIKEGNKDVDLGTEIADAFILLFDVAYQNGIDVADVVTEKMRINKAREWSVDEETGLMNHRKK